MTGAEVCAIAAIDGTPGDGPSFSADDLASLDPGPFSRLLPFELSNNAATADAQANAVLDQAAGQGAQWVLFVGAGERVHPRAFTMMAPAMAAYDAVWGGIGVGCGEEIETQGLLVYLRLHAGRCSHGT